MLVASSVLVLVLFPFVASSPPHCFQHETIFLESLNEWVSPSKAKKTHPSVSPLLRVKPRTELPPCHSKWKQYYIVYDTVTLYIMYYIIYILGGSLTRFCRVDDGGKEGMHRQGTVTIPLKPLALNPLTNGINRFNLASYRVLTLFVSLGSCGWFFQGLGLSVANELGFRP